MAILDYTKENVFYSPSHAAKEARFVCLAARVAGTVATLTVEACIDFENPIAALAAKRARDDREHDDTPAPHDAAHAASTSDDLEKVHCFRVYCDCGLPHLWRTAPGAR